MTNVLPFKKFESGKTTFADMIDEINSRFPVLTFRTYIDGALLSQVTILWGRIRDIDDNPNHVEIRSCDCDGNVCGHPTQRMYVSKNALRDWTYISGGESSEISILFEHRCMRIGR